MKRIYCLTLSCLFINIIICSAQNSVGIGTENSNDNAVLELVSPTNNQGFLVPRLTTSERTANSFTSNLTASDNGLLVFDSNENKFYYWHDANWQPLKNGPELVAGTGISIVNNTISNTGDADADPTNEIQDLILTGTTLSISNNAGASDIDLSPFTGTNTDNQNISFSANTLSIQNGNSVDLSPLINDADADPTNEIQSISRASNSLTLSGGGGSVSLFSGNFSDLSGVPVNLD
ncbi:hypothetical protein E1176_02385, partial [Fulvivirga sp. RKSG066]|nr:hypothetical protein [Fulvivirga aurantia]